MKKLLLIAVLIGTCLTSAMAQAPTGQYKYNIQNSPNPYASKLDTVSNTGADTLNAIIAGQRNSETFGVVATKISGDPSSTTVTLWGTPDAGTTWKQIVTHTLANQAGAQYFDDVVTGNPYTAYRYILTGVGTHSTSWKGTLLIR